MLDFTLYKFKCTRFKFGWGSAPDPAGGAHSAPKTLQEGKGVETKGGNQSNQETKHDKEKKIAERNQTGWP